MTAASQELLEALFDFAGVFPPAELDVATATEQYRSASAGDDGWVLGPMLLRASQLEEYRGTAPVGVVVDFPPSEIRSPVPLVQAEVRVAPGTQVADLAPLLELAPVIYLESTDPTDLDVIRLATDARAQGHDVRAKIRTGGATAAAFPSVDHVAEFILRCAAADVPFKATAGLHHPFRHPSDVTEATEHGFVNLMAATRCAIGGSPDAVAACLADTDPNAFDPATMTWRGEAAAVGPGAVRRLLRSIGSCSFDEPAGYLHELGALPATPPAVTGGKPFASEADLEEKEEVLEILADGVYALTAGGDPTVGAIEGEDFLICFEARATPYMAGRWLDRLRRHTDKPVRYLVLSHYHAVRTLGAAAFDADVIVAHDHTRELIAERGMEDWASEAGRMPRLFTGAETIPGLTWPTLTFSDRMTIALGGDRGTVDLAYLGRGHTKGDIVAWLPEQRILFAGDLVESEAALYTGDAYHLEWMTTTLDRVAALGAETLVGGRGRVVREDEVAHAIAQTRRFLVTLEQVVRPVQSQGGTLKEAFEAAHAALAPTYGGWPIFEHTLPFDVARMWDELAGVDPRVWTAARDRAIWAELQG